MRDSHGRALAFELYRAALKAADPERAVLAARLGTRSRLLSGRVKVVAAGKAAPAMLRGLKRKVSQAGGRIEEAWMVAPKGLTAPRGIRNLHRFVGSHPRPDKSSERAALAIEHALDEARSGETWIILLSGGASALLGAPRPGLSVNELARANDALLRSGAPIEEINAVRKHLTRLSGGSMLELLGRKSRRLRVLTLALSDVPSDRLDTIGSGPSVTDPTTFSEALRVIRRRKIALPDQALAYLKAGAQGARPETLKKQPRGIASHALIVASARSSLQAAARVAKARGYAVRAQGMLSGDCRTEATRQARLATRARGRTCILSGGELTVRVTGHGRGGRNQEFALAALCALEGARALVFSAGTDGRDGNTPAAGAWARSDLAEEARRKGLDPRAFLARNDSYSFFREMHSLVLTGPTGTNVMDFRALITGV